jgi:hypothetical protein
MTRRLVLLSCLLLGSIMLTTHVWDKPKMPVEASAGDGGENRTAQWEVANATQIVSVHFFTRSFFSHMFRSHVAPAR